MAMRVHNRVIRCDSVVRDARGLGRLSLPLRVMGIGMLLLWAAACADRPPIVFANHRDYPVSVHVGGDRVLILAPHTEEQLPYTVAAWTWPRLIEFRAYGTGEVLSAFRASAGDLAVQHWRVDLW